MKVANRILDTIRKPIEIDENPLAVAASIGIALMIQNTAPKISCAAPMWRCTKPKCGQR